jgi:hypothetical protein
MRRRKSPRFSKQHYIVLATALGSVRVNPPAGKEQLYQQALEHALTQITITLAEALKADNPAFDAEYFASTVAGQTKGTNCRYRS